MTGQTWLVFAVLAVTVGLFASDRLRLDLVAMMALLVLLLSKVLTVSEALAGFSDPLVLVIAGLFVVGGALFRTGVADRIGQLLSRIAGTQPLRLLVTIMVCVALLSAFLSSTGTVAILLPVVVRLAADAKVSPSKLLMPLSIASLLGGLLTLIGTPPNLVVAQLLSDRGQPSFGFFAFLPMGAVLVLVGVVFVATVGWRMLPDRTAPAGVGARGDADGSDSAPVAELVRAYDLPGNLWWMRVGAASPLLGQTLVESKLRTRHGTTILGVRRREDGATVTVALTGDYRYAAGDQLLLFAPSKRIHALGDLFALEQLPSADAQSLVSDDATVGEVLLTPRSRLIGRTLAEARFHEVYGLTVIAVLRRGRPVASALPETRLRFGDALLVQGAPASLASLRRSHSDLVVVGEASSIEPARLRARGVIALVLMLAMLALMTFKVVPTVTAVLLAAVAMVLFRCLDMEAAYRSISWESVVLIAAMLPMATALERSGGIALIVNGMVRALGARGAYPSMAALFWLTALFSQFVSNTATTVLVAPIALQIATRIGVSARPLMMVVAVAASTSFATPVASPVNTLILTPGGYRFADYAKLGVLLQLLAFAASMLLIPLLFPLRA
ncbi:MAG: SLC13 family permease [Myxococcales bacterium]|nr:SLC13 family permease [Myxococcales bacterium]